MGFPMKGEHLKDRRGTAEITLTTSALWKPIFVNITPDKEWAPEDLTTQKLMNKFQSPADIRHL